MKAYLSKVLLVGSLLFTLSSAAEDVDLFVGTPPSVTDMPNVLIVLDNTANWNTPFSNEMAALVSVVNSLPADKFKLGLMMFSETGSGNSGADGGYVRAAIRPLTAANKIHFQSLVSSLDVGNDKSNGGKAGQAMREAYLYFAAKPPFAGNNKRKADYLGNTSGNAASNAVYALAGNALTSISASPYVNPITSSCAKNFIIFISNGAAQDNASDTSSGTTALAGFSGNTNTISLSPSGSQSNLMDEWARFMKTSNLGIVTYAIDVNKVTTGQGPGWTALLKSASRGVGGGKYFDVTSSGTQILDALNLIFTEIQSVNSVFASVSLPVSVNTQGTYLNQVYVGMFRPDENSLPRWAGNLKQYKLGYVDTTLRLLDATDTGAINSQTGFIAECARSFWTPTTADNYWAFKPQGECLAIPNASTSNYPDGNIVEKGAQAFTLRSTTARNMYTCDPTMAGCTSLTSFSVGNADITSTLLGTTTAAERTATINWALGQDVDDENFADLVTPVLNTSIVMRPSVHGDVVHSQPVAINYGTDAAPQVVVFYGGNDGILRAINGNRAASIGLVPAGTELWSFMAPEFYSGIKRIHTNSPAINYPGSTTLGAVSKNYGFDGPISAYMNGGTKWIFASMRRGGSAIYAFDVGTAGSPSLKWKRGCDASGCSSANLSDFGQTWVAPKVVKAAGYGAGNSPILVVGGGYDTCEDQDPNTCVFATSKGNGIYVLDAHSGVMLNRFETSRSVVGDVVLVNGPTGLVNYMYVADLGGNIYRISGAANAPIGLVDPTLWVKTHIASLGCSGVSNCVANRKFMFAPDVLVDGSTHTLLIGSGDREKPLTHFLNAASVANYFFMIKDQPANPDWLIAEIATCGSAIICLDSLVPIAHDAASPTQAIVDAKKGWYLGMAGTEQVVTSAITVFGTVTFSTHTPAIATSGTCSNLGTAKVYNIGYGTAGYIDTRYETVSGGGLSPSPVAGMVTLDDGSTVPFLIGSSKDSALEGSLPFSPSSLAQPKAWVFWNAVR
ncbi:MAG: pilus assembly protein PilY [Pseudomonadota bacterium]